MTRCVVTFSPRYDIDARGLESLHRFDGRKYGKAWALLESRLGSGLAGRHLAVDREISREELLAVHDADYLDSLRRPQVIAEAFEVPVLAGLPAELLDAMALGPMRWATRGTLLASRAALEGGAAVNLGGGYHHAKRHRGEGFCLYADIAVAIEALRADGALGGRVAVIDLDAHQSNGGKSIFERDDRVVFFDAYNHRIYPPDRFERGAPNVDLPLEPGLGSAAYLAEITRALPPFLAAGSFELAFYVAGTDVYAGDPLGGLGVTFDDVVARDLFVTDRLTSAGVPWTMVLGGGYTDASHRMIAASVGALLER